jgi:DNA-binding Lrp family transcriptional regulator
METTPRKLTDLQGKLLNLIQQQVPLVERPFAALGEKLGLSETDVLQALRELKEGGRPIIRQISAIFDTKALGYRSSLVAAKVPEEKLEQAAEVINAHPGVSHNYKRNHDYNLWYTLAVPPDSKLGLERTVEILHRDSSALQTRLMPTLRLFKIGVKLNLGDEDIAIRSEGPRFTEADRDAAMAFPVTDEDKRMIRVLQQDLPLVERPFDQWARMAGVSVATLLASARAYEQQKRMRRFSAVLHHREVGFASNGMGVWVVAAGQEEKFGETAATFAAVSHCYLRPTYEDWPYNLFTMVHAQSKSECDQVMAAISKATGISNYAALYSSKEYKKMRVHYFTPEIELWEAAHLTA